MDFEIQTVDYSDSQHAADLVQLLNEYASDPMGGGDPIAESVQKTLPSELQKFPLAFSLIVYSGNQPAALANCFYGFSTFAAKKLINIHDLMVSKEFRGKGLSQLLLSRIEVIAREDQCSKITLEVLRNNVVAQNSYTKFGFQAYELNSDAGEALFWQKKLS